MESFSPLLCKIKMTFRVFLAAAPETQFHQSIHLAAFIWKSVSGDHRVIAMETEREGITQWQVSGGSGTDRHAPLGPCRPNQQGYAQTGARPQSAPMSLVETGLLSTWTRPWLVPAMLSLIHLPGGVCSQARWRGCMSSVKHATQNQCFITQPLNIYFVFSFWLGNWTEVRQAWQQEKFNSWEDGNNPNVPAADQQLNSSDIGFMRFKDLTHTHNIVLLSLWGPSSTYCINRFLTHYHN